MTSRRTLRAATVSCRARAATEWICFGRPAGLPDWPLTNIRALGIGLRPRGFSGSASGRASVSSSRFIPIIRKRGTHTTVEPAYQE